MHCANCGNQIDSTMAFCAKCGTPVGGGQPAPVAKGEIKSHMVGAIILTTLCIPAGIIPLIYACKVNSKLAQGDVVGAQKASKEAKFWVNLTIAILGAIIVLAIVSMVVDIQMAQKRLHAELQEGESTDGNIVFRSPDGWSLNTETNDNDDVIYNLTKEDGDTITLFSVRDSNDTKDSFEQYVAVTQNRDFEKLPHRTLADWELYVNNHKAFYRIMEYENEDGQPFYRHTALVFDSGTGRMVWLDGYLREQDESIIKRLLQSIRFYK